MQPAKWGFKPIPFGMVDVSFVLYEGYQNAGGAQKNTDPKD